MTEYSLNFYFLRKEKIEVDNKLSPNKIHELYILFEYIVKYFGYNNCVNMIQKCTVVAA